MATLPKFVFDTAPSRQSSKHPAFVTLYGDDPAHDVTVAYDVFEAMAMAIGISHLAIDPTTRAFQPLTHSAGLLPQLIAARMYAVRAIGRDMPEAQQAAELFHMLTRISERVGWRAACPAPAA